MFVRCLLMPVSPILFKEDGAEAARNEQTTPAWFRWADRHPFREKGFVSRWPILVFCLSTI